MDYLACTLNFVFSFYPIAFSLLPKEKEKNGLKFLIKQENHNFTNVSLFFLH